MGSTFTIRRFEQSDETQVVEIYRSVFGYPTAHNSPKLAIQKKLDFQPDLFFVAVEDEQVVGTVMGGYDGHRGWVYSLAVKENARGRGIATGLVRHLEIALHGLGCVKINLQILANNENVAAFYEKLGYQVEPRISMGKRFIESVEA